MIKHKIIFPASMQLESSYQLEDCVRRLRTVNRNELTFTPLDADRVYFCIRHVKSHAVPYPMVAFEVSGVLRRWGGTGTRIEAYTLRRLTVRVDLWVTLLVTLSIVSSVGLMIPALNHAIDNSLIIVALVIIGVVLGVLPLMAWVRQMRALHIDREIEMLHQSILRALSIPEKS